MKYIKQLGIILAIAFAGEILHTVIPLPIPVSIYGMILLFCCLLTGVLRLDQVKPVGTWLVEIMTILFLPACVGLMPVWPVLREHLVPFAVIVVCSTFLTMGVAGRVTQAVIGQKSPGEKEETA